MSHIVCITGGRASLFQASLALVQQLEQAGHRVTSASPHDWSNALAAYDAPFCQLDSWAERPRNLSPGSFWQKLRTVPERRQQAIASLGVQNFVPTLRSLQPDLVLIDIEMYPHIMAAIAAEEFTVALLCPFLNLWQQPCLPPLSSSMVPGNGWRGSRLGIALAWLRLELGRWRYAQTERIQQVGVDLWSVLRVYARQIGYPIGPYFGFTRMFACDQATLPILCLNAVELDFPHQPHPLMHYIGPMVREDRRAPQVTPEIQATLEQICDRTQSSNRVLIYYGCSSLARGNKHHLQTVIEAVAQKPQWELIMGLGGRLDPQELDPFPANVHAFPWAPQLQVLQRANCAIITAGINAINECIYFGVPMLVYSLGCVDQNGNSVRVKHHGLGIMGSFQNETAQQIRQSLEALLTEPSYQSRVNQMRDLFHQYRRDHRTVQIVTSLLAQSTTDSPSAHDSQMKQLAEITVSREVN